MLTWLRSIRFGFRGSFSRYTDASRDCMVTAWRRANEQHRAITPEDVLFGLAVRRRGLARAILEKLGLDLTQELDQISTMAVLPAIDRVDRVSDLDPRTDRVIAGSRDHARGLGLSYVGTEHLVPALLVEPGPAADFLVERGITLERYFEILHDMTRSTGGLL